MSSQGEQVRLAELIAALSLATDLGMGQPLEKAIRGCLLAVELGRHLGCATDTLRDVYYLALVQHIGCTAHAHEWASWVGGDEIAIRRYAVTWANSPPSEFIRSFARHAGEGLPLHRRATLVAAMMRDGKSRTELVERAQCEAAVCLATGMDMSPGVLSGLAHGLETWNGTGGPARLAGDDLALPARILAVAHDAEVFHRVGGLQSCRPAVGKRRGVTYDPMIADAFLRNARSIFAAVPDGPLWDVLLDAEPAPQVIVNESRFDAVARTFGEFVDLKVPFTVGHSGGVATLAEAAAGLIRGGDVDATALRRGAWLHDIGRVAVPNGIWERPGPLTIPDWELVRLHPYHGERMLSHTRPLAGVAALVGAHHERQDGSGYHRGSTAAQHPAAARLLAAADAYHAMTHERPHRPALTGDQAARQLRADVDAGRLDRTAVEAVLEAAGHPRRRDRAELPAGLSEREVEVLRLICLGLTNRQMGQRLFIADKTVARHIEHIYAKIGRSTRAGAALFAMEHGLVG